jgi:hypothetical protein
VAQVAVAREVEGARCERVREMVADVCWVVLVFCSRVRLLAHIS